MKRITGIEYNCQECGNKEIMPIPDEEESFWENPTNLICVYDGYAMARGYVWSEEK